MIDANSAVLLFGTLICLVVSKGDTTLLFFLDDPAFLNPLSWARIAIETSGNHNNNTTCITNNLTTTTSTTKAATNMEKLQDLEKEYTDRLEGLKSELKAALISQEEATNNPDALDAFLSSNDWDDKLVQYVILYEATPKGLAEFASLGPEQEFLVQSHLLANTALAKEILLADSPMAVQVGPRGVHTCIPAMYGPALKIYHDILQASEHATQAANAQGPEGILGRLALTIALEHAVPLAQENPEQPATAMEQFVDPVGRYLNYEMAYLEGELDPSFELLTTWELRMVIDGAEPDETLAWGREMLKSYRPDHIFIQNMAWRYVGMVNSNIRYGSGDVKFDRPELQLYQNILMNGGICGRRAFFGRFILRSFGIPTTARPSQGHGALCHWTPDQGWVTNLGPGWSAGWTKTRYRKDLDFLATTQARTNPEAYWKVKRAQWIGDVHEEQRIYGELDDRAEKSLGFWYGVSHKVQKAIIDAFPDKKVKVLQCTASHKPTIAEKVLAEKEPADAKTIQYDTPEAGTITIPAAAIVNPGGTKDVQIMKSFLGGLQMYLPDFKPQGLTVVRGGTWKCPPMHCMAGSRIKSGGYGKYEDWGFRVVISGPDPDEEPPKDTLTIDLGDDGKVKMEMVFVKPGSFIMGGESTVDGRFECMEVPKHKVTLTKGFYFGKYPVTQEQYEVIMGTNPSKSTKAPDCPVDNIGENDAVEYVDKLVETVGRDFRLPTEAEWEYAARGGSESKWFFGDDESKLGEYAWFKDNSDGKSHPVGQKKPNPFGLYDIFGNVFERCSDKYAVDYYEKSPEIDPTGPLQGTKSTFEYKIGVKDGGNYSLEAEVVTANKGQRLSVMVNGDESSTTTLEMPWTNGQWADSATITLTLKGGNNTIRFWRENPPQYGITIKKFTIKPAN